MDTKKTELERKYLESFEICSCVDKPIRSGISKKKLPSS
jgi:hypothetical protein